MAMLLRREAAKPHPLIWIEPFAAASIAGAHQPGHGMVQVYQPLSLIVAGAGLWRVQRLITTLPSHRIADRFAFGNGIEKNWGRP